MPNLGGWTGLLLVLIVLIIFAAPKLPQMARSVAQSMNIFKSEIKRDEDARPASDDAVVSSADEKNPKN